MESLTQKLHPGVVINFQKIGGVSPPSSSTAHAAREATPMETDEKGTYILIHNAWRRVRWAVDQCCFRLVVY